MESNDEKPVMVDIVAMSHKEMREKFESWAVKSREKAKPYCPTCARLDANNGKLGEFEDYTKNMTEVSRSVNMVRESNSKLETPIKHIMIDYRCPKGHGFSFDFRYEDWELLTKPKNKEAK